MPSWLLRQGLVLQIKYRNEFDDHDAQDQLRCKYVAKVDDFHPKIPT